jgi:hypothetical protein
MDMKMNKYLHSLDLLGNIKKVDTPPFLLTRIKQKIAEGSSSLFSLKLSWSLTICFLLVLALNAIVFVNNTAKINNETSLVQSMDLLPNNSIYK